MRVVGRQEKAIAAVPIPAYPGNGSGQHSTFFANRPRSKALPGYKLGAIS